MKYLLDTNICIYIIKEKPPTVIGRFKELSIGDIGISTITLAELQYGIEKSVNQERNREALRRFITPMEILNFDFNATIEYGKIRANLERLGIPIGSLDTLIAAHALSKQLTLVTNNTREFSELNN